MTNFKSNNISLGVESVAEQLSKARQEKKLKLKDIAKKLNINYKYLKALEKGEYNKLPTGVYGKNFLREYAFFLGLDYNELVKIFKQEKGIYQNPGQQKLFSKQIVKRHYFLAVPKIVKISIIIAVTVIFFIYLGFSLKEIISPPNLFIYSPIENFTTEKKSIQVSGETEAEAQVIINGEQILSDAAGRFFKIVNLKNGINIITITACKKYGRDSTVVRQVLVK
ncbi:helix-turn-helix domain-containing protein [Candidatus Parcubacteria bacterium]|nr:helix-turn-helix domain-containing protein [Candidatus Parcubacteria bacterium]